jgi:hypothetical protein
VPLIGILEHPDVPKSIFGITGLNFFNLLLVNVFFAWQAQRQREKLKWDMPPHMNVLLLMYLGVILVGWYRLYSEPGFMAATETKGSMIAEYLINTLKWPVLALLLFDGCRSRERLFMGRRRSRRVRLPRPHGHQGDAARIGADGRQRAPAARAAASAQPHRVSSGHAVDDARGAALAGLADADSLITIGRGPTLAIAREAALKLKEIANRHAEPFSGAEFLHGPVALVEPRYPILMFVPAAGDRLMSGFSGNEYNSQVSVNDYEVAQAGRSSAAWIRADFKKPAGLGTAGDAADGNGELYVVLNEEFGHPHNATSKPCLTTASSARRWFSRYLTMLFMRCACSSRNEHDGWPLAVLPRP